MRTENKVDCIHEYIKFTPPKKQQELMEQNYDLYVRDGKVVFEKPDRVVKEDVEKEKQELKKKAKNNTLTMDDITNFITNYL